MQRLIADMKQAEATLERAGNEYLEKLKELGVGSIEEMWDSAIPLYQQNKVNVLFNEYNRAKLKAEELASQAEIEIQKQDLKNLRKNWGAL